MFFFTRVPCVTQTNPCATSYLSAATVAMTTPTVAWTRSGSENTITLRVVNTGSFSKESHENNQAG